MAKKKKLEDALTPEEEFFERIGGGVVIDMSDCCNAPVTYTECGVRIPICSKCGKIYEELTCG